MGAVARVGGRNSWIAVPAGLACAAIVAGLVWLSMPMVPVTLAWAGDMLRNATAPKTEPATADTPAKIVAAGGSLDCREFYSDSLWNELTWTGRTILDQTLDPPPTEVPTLTEVLAPDVGLTCGWTKAGGESVVSTLAVVAPDAPAIAEAALRGQGFSCAVGEAGLRCARTQGEIVETSLFHEGLWLVSVERAWHPEDYAPRLERQVFG